MDATVSETIDREALVEMLVRYKPEVPDPMRAKILETLRAGGETLVTAVDCCKYFHLKIRAESEDQARDAAIKVGEILLANPVTERFEILSVDFS